LSDEVFNCLLWRLEQHLKCKEHHVEEQESG